MEDATAEPDGDEGQLDISGKYLLLDSIKHDLPKGKYLVLQLDDPNDARKHAAWMASMAYAKTLRSSGDPRDHELCNKLNQLNIAHREELATTRKK